MKKFFMFIIYLAAAVILGYGLHRAVSPVSSESLELTTYEQSAPAKGYIIRDESIYYAERSGILYNNAGVGSRVAKDSLLYTIYDSAADDTSIQELNVINGKIKLAAEMQNSSMYGAETGSVEGDISLRVKSIIDAARKNDVTRISQYKQDINDLNESGKITKPSERLSDLEYKKGQIEEKLGGSKTETYAKTSGIFTSYYDGFEDKIDINNLDNCTVDYIESLGEPKITKNTKNSISEGDFVCSVVNNHLWFVLLTVETDEAANLKIGETISIRFKNIANQIETGTVTYISGGIQDSNGKSFILVEFTDYFDGAFSYRTADADLVFESYTGYRIPADAIRIKDGKYTVPALRNNREYICEVDILYSSTKGGYVIVNSADNAQNDLSSMDRIVIGER